MINIDVMLSRPGIYFVQMPLGFGLVEVDHRGMCFQLELVSGAYARDGELTPGGWNIHSVLSIDGPFARVKS